MRQIANASQLAGSLALVGYLLTIVAFKDQTTQMQSKHDKAIAKLEEQLAKVTATAKLALDKAALAVSKAPGGGGRGGDGRGDGRGAGRGGKRGRGGGEDPMDHED